MNININKENYICGHVHDCIKNDMVFFCCEFTFDRKLTLNFTKLEFMEKKKYR